LINTEASLQECGCGGRGGEEAEDRPGWHDAGRSDTQMKLIFSVAENTGKRPWKEGREGGIGDETKGHHFWGDDN